MADLDGIKSLARAVHTAGIRQRTQGDAQMRELTAKFEEQSAKMTELVASEKARADAMEALRQKMEGALTGLAQLDVTAQAVGLKTAMAEVAALRERVDRVQAALDASNQTLKEAVGAQQSALRDVSASAAAAAAASPVEAGGGLADPATAALLAELKTLPDKLDAAMARLDAQDKQMRVVLEVWHTILNDTAKSYETLSPAQQLPPASAAAPLRLDDDDGDDGGGVAERGLQLAAALSSPAPAAVGGARTGFAEPSVFRSAT